MIFYRYTPVILSNPVSGSKLIEACQQAAQTLGLTTETNEKYKAEVYTHTELRVSGKGIFGRNVLTVEPINGDSVSSSMGISTGLFAGGCASEQQVQEYVNAVQVFLR